MTEKSDVSRTEASVYEPCVIDEDGQCKRWSHNHYAEGPMADTSEESLAERTMREVYGYTRRPGQSRDFVTVPLALVQEAHDAAMSGDSKALLKAMLVHGRTHVRD